MLKINMLKLYIGLAASIFSTNFISNNLNSCFFSKNIVKAMESSELQDDSLAKKISKPGSEELNSNIEEKKTEVSENKSDKINSSVNDYLNLYGKNLRSCFVRCPSIRLDLQEEKEEYDYFYLDFSVFDCFVKGLPETSSCCLQTPEEKTTDIKNIISKEKLDFCVDYIKINYMKKSEFSKLVKDENSEPKRIIEAKSSEEDKLSRILDEIASLESNGGVLYLYKERVNDLLSKKKPGEDYNKDLYELVVKLVEDVKKLASRYRSAVFAYKSQKEGSTIVGFDCSSSYSDINKYLKQWGRLGAAIGAYLEKRFGFGSLFYCKEDVGDALYEYYRRVLKLDKLIGFMGKGMRACLCVEYDPCLKFEITLNDSMKGKKYKLLNQCLNISSNDQDVVRNIVAFIKKEYAKYLLKTKPNLFEKRTKLINELDGCIEVEYKSTDSENKKSSKNETNKDEGVLEQIVSDAERELEEERHIKSIVENVAKREVDRLFANLNGIKQLELLRDEYYDFKLRCDVFRGINSELNKEKISKVKLYKLLSCGIKGSDVLDSAIDKTFIDEAKRKAIIRYYLNVELTGNLIEKFGKSDLFEERKNILKQKLVSNLASVIVASLVEYKSAKEVDVEYLKESILKRMFFENYTFTKYIFEISMGEGFEIGSRIGLEKKIVDYIVDYIFKDESTKKDLFELLEKSTRNKINEIISKKIDEILDKELDELIKYYLVMSNYCLKEWPNKDKLYSKLAEMTSLKPKAMKGLSSEYLENRTLIEIFEGLYKISNREVEKLFIDFFKRLTGDSEKKIKVLHWYFKKYDTFGDACLPDIIKEKFEEELISLLKTEQKKEVNEELVKEIICKKIDEMLDEALDIVINDFLCRSLPKLTSDLENSLKEKLEKVKELNIFDYLFDYLKEISKVKLRDFLMEKSPIESKEIEIFEGIKKFIDEKIGKIPPFYETALKAFDTLLLQLTGDSKKKMTALRQLIKNESCSGEDYVTKSIREKFEKELISLLKTKPEEVIGEEVINEEVIKNKEVIKKIISEQIDEMFDVCSGNVFDNFFKKGLEKLDPELKEKLKEKLEKVKELNIFDYLKEISEGEIKALLMEKSKGIGNEMGKIIVECIDKILSSSLYS